jgi:hypothetical protein
MISFEFKNKNALSDELEIFLDHEGLSSLISQLEILKNGRTDHVHLMSESWGGSHLEDRACSESNSTIKHVKITRLSL